MKKLLLLIITMQITLFAKPYIQISSGDVVEEHVDYLEKKYYEIKVPKTQTVTVKLTDLDADLDLYIATNRIAKIRDNDCYSSNGHTKNEECVLSSTSPKGETNSIIIMVYGFKASNYKLEVTTKDGANEITEISDTPLEAHVDKGTANQYKFSGKKGETYITTLSSLTADADLRVKIGKKASMHSFDCKSTKGGKRTDVCLVILKKDATVYVHVDGYKEANYNINVLKDNTLQELPKTRLYTEDKEFFLAYRKGIDNSTEIFVVNNETKKVTEHRQITNGLSEKYTLSKIENSDIFISDALSTPYAIDRADGKLKDISDSFKRNNYYKYHFNNYTKDKILKVQYINNNIIEEYSYNVSKPISPDLVNKNIYKEKEALNFIAQYNCNNLNQNNKIDDSTYNSFYICSQKANEAYILYKDELTLIDINKPNTPIMTLETPHLDGEEDSLHKINENSFYTMSTEVSWKKINVQKYSIYKNNKLILSLKETVTPLNMYIETIEFKGTDKIVIRQNNLGIKIYDISDISNPKLIKDDSPEHKITILK